MKNSTLRDLILDISEIDENRNPFAIAQKMMIALKNDEITSEQFSLLSGTLLIECSRSKIITPNATKYLMNIIGQ